MIDVAKRPMLVPLRKFTSLSLPSEIFHLILSYVNLDDIAKLISINTPLHHPNIRDAITSRLQKCQIVATNRYYQPSHMDKYAKGDSFVNREYAEYLSDPLALPLLLLAVSPLPVVTVSFYVSSLRDIHKFIRLVEMLPTTFGVKYNLELEFNPGILHVIDLLMIVSGLGDLLADALKILMITNYNGDLQLDMLKFHSLEALWLENTNVTFKSSFEQNLELARLFLHPNYNGFSGNNAVIIDHSLPENLVMMHLGQSVVVELSLNYTFPEKITDLTVMTVRDTLMQYMPRLFERSPAQRTTMVYETALAECSGHANYYHILGLLEREHVILKLGITSIRNEEGSWDFSHKLTLREFKISKSNVRLLRLPPTLTHLDVSNNNIEDPLKIVFGNATDMLVLLNMSDNPVDWLLMPDQIRFPPNLEDLRLTNTNIGQFLPRMVFPELLRHVALGCNQIELICGLKLSSPYIEELDLTCNLISKANVPWLPSGMKVLKLTENLLTGPLDLSRDMHGFPTCLEQIYLSNNNLLTLADLNLPSTVRILNLDECNISSMENIAFPSSLEELSINGCDLSQVANVTFGCGSRLRVLNLAQNRLTETDLRLFGLPKLLHHLNLSGNSIAKLRSSEFADLSQLQSLSLSRNKLRLVELQLHTSVENLDLSYNQISELQLHFPVHRESQLAELNLSSNKLTYLTPRMIGHGVSALSSLVEMDISGNNVKLASLQEFPQTLMCMVEGISGIQDRYGYDIGANVLGNSYCLGKRIDVPSL